MRGRGCADTTAAHNAHAHDAHALTRVALCTPHALRARSAQLPATYSRPGIYLLQYLDCGV